MPSQYFSEISIKKLVFLLLILAGGSSCKKNLNSDLSFDDSEEGVELDMETQDVDLPGPVENLMSLLYDTPVYGSSGERRTQLRYDPARGLDPIPAAISALGARPDLIDALRIQDAGTTMITTSYSELGARGRGFNGVCVGNTVFALTRADANTGATNLGSEIGGGGFTLQKAAYMSETYRPDIQGCRERFLELVRTKFQERQDAEGALLGIEVMNFVFGFIPGYAGTENISEGNTSVGIAEITADVATLGFASKFKAGWRSLNMSKRMFRSVQTGFKVSALGANTVRLGSVINDVSTRGASISDIPTTVLLLAETGFVLAKIKAKKVRLSAGQRVAENMTHVKSLSESLSKLGRRLIPVPPGSISAMFKGKYAGVVSPEELERIRRTAAQGGDLGLEDLHKLMSNTSLKKPDTLVNVTQDSTLLQVMDSNGIYHGYVGFPGLPKGVYATGKPISWSAFDMATTPGNSNVPRDTMLLFVGEASQSFSKLKVESSFFGRSTAVSKTALKPNNPEFATRSGDVQFRDFSVYNDGSKSVVVVRRIQILDTVKGHLPGSPEYRRLTRLKVGPFALVVLTDAAYGFIVTVGPLTALGGAAVAVEWLFSEEE